MFRISHKCAAWMLAAAVAGGLPAIATWPATAASATTAAPASRGMIVFCVNFSVPDGDCPVPSAGARAGTLRVAGLAPDRRVALGAPAYRASRRIPAA